MQIDPTGRVTVTAAANPFSMARDTVEVREGGSIADMLAEAQPDPILVRHAVVFIGGHMIERRYWRSVYPKAGALVEIRVMPSGGGGGGKNILRSVLTIAVIAAAFVIVPPLGAGATAGQLAGASFLRAGVALLGQLAISALVPVKQPKARAADDSDPFSIQGFRNRARPFEPVPQILGRRRVAPDYGAQLFTEIVGKDQFLRAVFVWGVGPLHIDESSIKIGETPITDFEGVEIEHRQGYADDDPLTLYSNTVFEDSVQVLLGTSNENQGSTGPQVRTAPAVADELSIDITMPLGLVNINTKNGNRDAFSVEVSVEYRAVGDTAWLTPNFTAKTFPDDWVSGNIITITGRRQAAIRHGMRWSVPTRGEYEVRVEFLSEARGSDKTDTTFWSALRAITDEDPISSRVPVAKTAIKIKASDQLNGVLDELNGVVTTLGKDWNGTAWVDDQQITRPASLFRHVLQGNANAVALGDGRLNLDVLEDWHDFCVANDFTCNLFVGSGGSVWETLSDVAGAGRASPAEIDGGWGVVIDRPQAVPVSHITPRNSANFTAEKAFTELPHAFRIPFVNEAEGWRQDERRVYRTGFNADNATRFEQLTIPGVTNSDQVFRLGRYRMAQGIHQPERWSFSQNMEFLTYTRGDRVKITHDVLLVGRASGRIKDVILDASDNITGLVLDEEVVMDPDAGELYAIAIRTLSDANITRQVPARDGARTTIDITPSIAPVGGFPPVNRGDLFGFGLLGAETDDAQIVSIVPRNEYDATITAVPYREAVYASDSETIPPFDTNLTPLPGVPAPIIRNIFSGQVAVAFGPGESLRVRVVIEVSPLDQASRFRGARLEVQSRATGTGEPWAAAQVDENDGNRVTIGGVREGEVVDFRVRWVPPARLPGPWTKTLAHTVEGRTIGMGVNDAPIVDLTPFTIFDGDDFPRRAVLRLSWTGDPPLGASRLQFQLRQLPGLGIIRRGTVDIEEGEFELNDVIPDTTYEARARYVANPELEWSDWVSATTSNLRFTERDLESEFADRIDAAFERHDAALESLTSGAVFDLLNEVRIQDAIGLAQEVTGKAQQVVAFEEAGDNAAAIVTEQTARADADSALASDVTALGARVGDNEAAISNIQTVKVDASGAVSAVEQTISATYASMTALATATSFAEATIDGISSGFVWSLGGDDVLSLVQVSDGVTEPVTTARIKSDFIRLDGDTEVTGDFKVSGDNMFANTITADEIIADGITRFGVAGSGAVNQGGATWLTIASFNLALPVSANIQGTLLFTLSQDASLYPSAVEFQVVVAGSVRAQLPFSALVNAGGRAQNWNFTYQGIGAGTAFVQFRIRNAGGAGVNSSNISAVAFLR